jgi:hypothetical protein
MCHTDLSQSHKRVRFCQLVAKWDQMAKISGPVDDLIADKDWPWLAIFFLASRRLHKIALFFMCRIPKGCPSDIAANIGKVLQPVEGHEGWKGHCKTATQSQRGRR